MHARGFTAGQKTVENPVRAGPPGRGAVAGRWPFGPPGRGVSSSCMTPWNVLRHQCLVLPLGAKVWPHVPLVGVVSVVALVAVVRVVAVVAVVRVVAVVSRDFSDFKIHYGEALVRQTCERLLPVTSLVVVQASFPAVGRLSGTANTPSWGSVHYVSKLHCIFIESLIVKMHRWYKNVHFTIF